MVFVTGTVYEPPAPEFPFILVFFDAEGDIRVIRVVESAEAGRALLDKMTESLAQFGLAELKPGRHADEDTDVAKGADLKPA
jgi:hypothetical protein